MLLALTLVSPDPLVLAEAGRRTAPGVASGWADVKPVRALGPGATDRLIEAEAIDPVRQAVQKALADLPVDLCVQPHDGRRKRLFVADMDSTIIGCECLDELADFAGVKERVSAITERAMRGEIDFEAALRERVGLLKGMPLQALDQCMRERVRLNPGARTLVRTLTGHGVRCVLVTGGFESFAGPVAQAAGFVSFQANRLLFVGETLSGELGEPILGREAKLQAMRRHARELGIGLQQAVAVGDGANDLAMIEAAGLGVAYRAKPVVAARAHARIDHADLTALLYFQGYEAADFAQD